uniref:Cupin type-1 domain-containing protein n=1 Tax=Oryza glumipatula TaxID=40148 RepID=A0A0E0ASI4_9ORYZ
MASSSLFLLGALLVLASWQAIVAYDPSPLQDFCVADMNSPVRVNGFACKNPMDVSSEDFFNAAKFDMPRNTFNKLGSNVTNLNVMEFPGLNTLGISLARIDYAPMGVNPPHVHPRATELLTVLEGTLYVGFVTSNPNKLFSKVVYHDKPAVAQSALSSQNPGVITIASAVFGSQPPISNDVLTKAFQVEKKLIDWLQSQFWENNY